ncbi:MAG: Kelch repeat-containing protein [Actinomycetota bacterium]
MGLGAAWVPTAGQAAAPPAWEEVGDMRQPREGHTATLLSGPDCGGQHRAVYCGQVLVAGGFQWVGSVPIDGRPYDPRDSLDKRVFQTAEIFDPKSRQWAPTGSLEKARWGHQAVGLPDGRVLVMGGEGGANGPTLASAELYDPRSKKWKLTGSLHVPRWLFTATLLQGQGCGSSCGKVLVVGGGSSAPASTSAELFDPKSESWSSAGSLTEPRASHTATLVSGPRCGSICGQVLVAGPLKTTELYDPSKGTWTPVGEMVVASSQGSAALLSSGDVLVIGSGAALNPGSPGHTTELNAQLFDPMLGTWTSTRPPGGRRVASFLTRLGDGGVLAAGGEKNNTAAAIYYRGGAKGDPNGVWEPAGNLKLARALQAQTLLGCSADSPVLITGGGPSDSTTTPTVELFKHQPRDRGESGSQNSVCLSSKASSANDQGQASAVRGTLLAVLLAMALTATLLAFLRRFTRRTSA